MKIQKTGHIHGVVLKYLRCEFGFANMLKHFPFGCIQFNCKNCNQNELQKVSSVAEESDQNEKQEEW